MIDPFILLYIIYTFILFFLEIWKINKRIKKKIKKIWEFILLKLLYMTQNNKNLNNYC